MSAFTEALRAASTDAEALAAIARAVNPDATAPTPEALAEWWPQCPDAERAEADAALRALVAHAAPDAPATVRAVWGTGAVWVSTSEDGGYAPVAATWHHPYGGAWVRGSKTVRDVGREWLAAHREGFEEPHPLAPIVRAWIGRAQPVAPWPGKRRVSVPDFDAESDELDLPDLGDQPPKPGQLELLPGFDSVDESLPHWVLRLFALSGGPIAEGSRLPRALTLAIGALCRLPVENRTGTWKTLRFPHRSEHEDLYEERFGERVDAVERWIAPDGWSNRYRDWERLPSGLWALHRRLSYLPIPGVGWVSIVYPSVIPKKRTDPLVEFTIRIPASAARGARMDWPLFAAYAAESATLGRAYLSAVAFMGRSARDGHPITRQLPAPILNANGEPIRRKGGKIVRSTTELAPNPQARFVKALTDTQLAWMIGHPHEAARDKRKRHRAREVFERLDADGVIELAPDGKRFRIFGPGK